MVLWCCWCIISIRVYIFFSSDIVKMRISMMVFMVFSISWLLFLMLEKKGKWVWLVCFRLCGDLVFIVFVNLRDMFGVWWFVVVCECVYLGGDCVFRWGKRGREVVVIFFF